MTITSLNNATVKLLSSLRLEKYRAQHGLFLIEGERMALDALKAGHAPHLLAVVPGQAQNIIGLQRACAEAGGTFLAVTPEVMRKIVQRDNPQGVAAAYPIRRKPLAYLVPQAGDLFVALDRIRDPGNLGTIIRTAHAVKAAGVLLIGPSCDPYAVESVRATTGSIFRVPIYDGREEEFIALSRTWPGSVVGTAADGRSDYREISYKTPVIILMGSEQSGLSAALQNACPVTARIPMYGDAESLNVSVAAGVVLYGIRQVLA